jgi:hypothetical protein
VFTESAVNRVISSAWSKQHMRWTARGAHLLLQVRTRVLNDRFAGEFYCWYLGLNQAPDPCRARAVASPRTFRSPLPGD